jgi:hypothetical protein
MSQKLRKSIMTETFSKEQQQVNSEWNAMAGEFSQVPKKNKKCVR